MPLELDGGTLITDYGRTDIGDPAGGESPFGVGTPKTPDRPFLTSLEYRFNHESTDQSLGSKTTSVTWFRNVAN